MELDITVSNGAMEDIDSTSSTPYVSAPSSPGSSSAVPFAGGGYFFSAPASPMHFVLSTSPAAAAARFSPPSASVIESANSSFEFEFSGRNIALSSADELFLNGQIRPMKLSSHLQRPQILSPLLDLDNEDEDDEDQQAQHNNRNKQGDGKVREEDDENAPVMVVRGRDLRFRCGSIHRRTRSMSPLRNPRYHWAAEDEEEEPNAPQQRGSATDEKSPTAEMAAAMDTENTPPSASSSRSSSSGRNSKRWIFLKDLLYRSKSEGREREQRFRDKFWQSLSFSPSSAFILNLKERSNNNKPSTSSRTQSSPSSSSTSSDSNQKQNQKQKQEKQSWSLTSTASASSSSTSSGKKRRIPRPSPHERHYTTNRAHAEEMRKRTFLPYRQGLLGCLGFSSRSYGAMNGLARSLNTVYSR